MTEPSDQTIGLTRDELFVLDLLASAWNKWVILDGRDADDDAEFRHAIHAAQHLVGMRVARRADPKIWRQRITPNEQVEARGFAASRSNR